MKFFIDVLMVCFVVIWRIFLYILDIVLTPFKIIPTHGLNIIDEKPATKNDATEAIKKCRVREWPPINYN